MFTAGRRRTSPGCSRPIADDPHALPNDPLGMRSAWLRHRLHPISFNDPRRSYEPGFAAAVIATLGLGHGASTVMFTRRCCLFRRFRRRAEPSRRALGSPARIAHPRLVGPEAAMRDMSRSFSRSPSTMRHRSLRTTDGAERIRREMVSPVFRAIGACRSGRHFFPRRPRPQRARRRRREPGVLARSICLRFVADRAHHHAERTPICRCRDHARGIRRALLRYRRLVPGDDGLAHWRRRGQSRRALAHGPRTVADGHPGPASGTSTLSRAADEIYLETNTDRGVRLMSLRENYLGSTGNTARRLFAPFGCC